MTKTEPHALLLTGPPGVGKTTVLRRAAEELADLTIRGFTTEEIREAGQRAGFRIETFDGRSDILAHVKIRSPHKVSKYGVDLATLDRVVEEQLSPARADVVLIDEIGKMESLSSRFVETVESLLNSSTVLVATVALRGGGFIETVKRRPGVLLWEVSRTNRRGSASGSSIRSGSGEAIWPPLRRSGAPRVLQSPSARASCRTSI